MAPHEPEGLINGVNVPDSLTTGLEMASETDPAMGTGATSETGPGVAQGSLKIFFGYAAGVGKTYAMLSAAHAAKKAGVDVVAGYVEPHMRPETQALLDGLEVLPTLPINYHGAVLQEFDLDGAIRRHPQLILVDEMAHTNARGCRHVKRYQDIQELLRHGIDVYTTVNVQHVESLNDVVESITGITVRERVPDKVFDSADHVELVDIEPDELLGRLEQGKIYRQKQANMAMGNFFARENLAALREIALRRTADIINRTVEKNKSLLHRNDYFTNEHLLVCLSSSPSNAKVIRTAARMAEGFHGRLTALFVETSSALSPENKARLEANARLAEELGANLASVEGDDVPWHVAEFAKASGVSKIVIGRPGTDGIWFFRKPNLLDQLITLAPNLDIFVIPNQMQGNVLPVRRAPKFKPFSGLRISWQDVLWGAGFLAGSTVVGFAFRALGFSESTTIMAYMLGVLLAAMHTSGLFFSTLYALASVLAFNFFFTEPRFSFQVNDPAYIVTFAVMLVASGVISTLAKRLQQQKSLASQRAYRTSRLLETSQKLQAARDYQEIIRETGRQLMHLLGRTVIMYPARDGVLGSPVSMEAADQADMQAWTGKEERAVAEWSLRNRKQAGAGTSTLPGARCLYLCIRGQEESLGVAAVVVDGNPLDSFEKGLFMAVLGECSLALENERIRESKDTAFLQAKQESLRANMLRAISHDLRTPLTSISGNAHLLLSNGKELPEETRQRLYADIDDDAAWLISLVENILSVTRLEDGTLPLKLEPELVGDCIREALRHVHHRSADHHVEVLLEDELLLARMDARLIMQVIVNMVDNAIKYTPEGSVITLSARRQGEEVRICVGDNGPGIPDDAKEHLFDMFFTASQNQADSRRGLGLGLSLCKSIVVAHGGQIAVQDNIPHGSLFVFTLSAAEIPYE